MKRTTRRTDIPALVRAMVEAGATFFFTEAGTLLVRGLDALPAWLADEFFQADAPELARYVREAQKRDDQAA